jgi:Dolichol kinase
MRELFAGAGVLLVLGSAMLITRLLKARLSAEVSRKIIHITMGCTALSFPYVFEKRQSVVILGLIAIGAMLLLRLHKGIRKNVGSSLFDIKRKSFGELYYIASIIIVFVLHQSVVEYLIPILVLTFADSVAALVGTNYGKNNLANEQEDKKSSEGSVMFFVTAFLCTLVPLQLMTEVGRAEVLVISFLIGLLAAMIEAVSRNGNDNFLLPLLVYSFLRYNMTQSLTALVINFFIMLFFLAITIFVYKATSISKLSIIYALLVGYVVLIQGDVSWILPPLAMILTFGTLPMMKEKEKQAAVPYQIVDANSFVGLVCVWVLVFAPQYRDILYLAFSLSFACHLTLNTYNRFKNHLGVGGKTAVLCGIAKAVVFIAFPTLLITRMNWLLFALYMGCLLASVPPEFLLKKKFDFDDINIKSARVNEVLVGVIVLIFSAVAIALNGVTL